LKDLYSSDSVSTLEAETKVFKIPPISEASALEPAAAVFSSNDYK